jgi:hypothetical protein
MQRSQERGAADRHEPECNRRRSEELLIGTSPNAAIAWSEELLMGRSPHAAIAASAAKR